MNPRLFHLYGPFYIQIYGLMIAIGLAIALYMLQHDNRLMRLISPYQFNSLILLGFIGALIGGRALYLLSAWDNINTWQQVYSLHEGGLSVLGAIMGTLLSLAWYLKNNNISTLQVFDIMVIYVPLLQSISRLGCFFAGCCYGKPSTLPWAIQYTHYNSLAPLNIALHPSQIYSTILLFIIFCFIYWFSYRIKSKIPGQLTMLYLILISSERFLLDFFRADQSFFSMTSLAFFSFDQWIACSIFCCSYLYLLFITQRRQI